MHLPLHFSFILLPAQSKRSVSEFTGPDVSLHSLPVQAHRCQQYHVSIVQFHVFILHVFPSFCLSCALSNLSASVRDFLDPSVQSDSRLQNLSNRSVHSARTCSLVLYSCHSSKRTPQYNDSTLPFHPTLSTAALALLPQAHNCESGAISFLLRALC